MVDHSRALVPVDAGALATLDAAGDFVEWLAGQRSGETSRAYAADLRQFAGYLREVHKLDDLRRLTVRHFTGYPKWLLDHGYAVSSIRRKLASVKSACNYLTALGFYASSPAATVRAYRVPDISPRVALTGDEARRLLEAARSERGNRRDYAILLTLGTLALRRSELCKLQCADVAKRDGHVVVKVRGKGGSEAFLPLPPHVQEAIRRYSETVGREVDDVVALRTWGAAPLFMPTRNNRADLHAGTLAERNHKPLHSNSVLKIVHKYGALAGLELDAHTLRHTAITMAFDKGATLRRVQAMARHADPRTTTRYDSRASDLNESAVYLVQY